MIGLYSHFTTLCDGSVAKRDVLLGDLADRLGLVLVATKREEYESTAGYVTPCVVCACL